MYLAVLHTVYNCLEIVKTIGMPYKLNILLCVLFNQKMSINKETLLTQFIKESFHPIVSHYRTHQSGLQKRCPFVHQRLLTTLIILSIHTIQTQTVYRLNFLRSSCGCDVRRDSHQAHTTHSGHHTWTRTSPSIQTLLSEEEIEFVIVPLRAVRNLLHPNKYWFWKINRARMK